MHQLEGFLNKMLCSLHHYALWMWEVGLGGMPLTSQREIPPKEDAFTKLSIETGKELCLFCLVFARSALEGVEGRAMHLWLFSNDSFRVTESNISQGG